MAPLRRYLRISKYSVLETRIYLDNPAHSETWLLRRSDPALSRIIEAVRPLVLPKLREEREREGGKGKGKGKGKKGVRDVISGDDFEVSIFLTPTTTRHTLLTKRKEFKDKPQLKSNSGKLTGWLNTGTSDRALEVEPDPVVREEEDEHVDLSNIPEANPVPGREAANKRTKRRRADDEQAVFVQSSSDSDEALEPLAKSSRGKRGHADQSEDDVAAVQDEVDDKKKLALETSYEGFSIYGRILCLVVKRKGAAAKGTAGTSRTSAQHESSQQMMEHWVSTQAAGAQGDDEDEEDGKLDEPSNNQVPASDDWMLLALAVPAAGWQDGQLHGSSGPGRTVARLPSHLASTHHLQSPPQHHPDLAPAPAQAQTQTHQRSSSWQATPPPSTRSPITARSTQPQPPTPAPQSGRRHHQGQPAPPSQLLLHLALFALLACPHRVSATRPKGPAHRGRGRSAGRAAVGFGFGFDGFT